MLAAGVVGVITVGVDGRAVISAKATIPFLARFIGHGVESGDTAPVIVNVKVSVSNPQAFAAVIWTLTTPTSVGVPEITPVSVFTTKPSGSGTAL